MEENVIVEQFLFTMINMILIFVQSVINGLNPNVMILLVIIVRIDQKCH